MCVYIDFADLFQTGVSLLSALYRIPNLRRSQEADSAREYADLQYIRNTVAGKAGGGEIFGGNRNL